MKSVRYWDKAGTESDDAAFTAGALIHILKDNRFVIEHVVRGQWSALDREEKIKFWAERDRANSRPGAYEVGVEQEPGSGGKESAESTIRNLRGFKVYADKVTGPRRFGLSHLQPRYKAETSFWSRVAIRTTSWMRWFRFLMASLRIRLTRAPGRSIG